MQKELKKLENKNMHLTINLDKNERESWLEDA